MSDELLINVTPQETRIATIENGMLQEVAIERECKRGLLGNIYKGRVTRVLPGMQAAFVDIGLDRTGFLHLFDMIDTRPQKLDPLSHQDKPENGSVDIADEPEDAQVSEEKILSQSIDKEPLENTSIQDMLAEGQEILVQVIKDPIGSKGARLSMRITIPARYLVYMPNTRHIALSQRLCDDAERQRLKQCVKKLQQNFEQGGYIVRTVADGKDEDAIYSDMCFLNKLWCTIVEQGKRVRPGTLIHEDLPLVMRTMRDISEDKVNLIRIDSRETFKKVQHFAQKFIPDLVDKIQYYPGESPIFDLFNIETEIHKALQPKIELKSGGYIIIDQTEAMTTIDVNTGSYVGTRNLEETIFKTNLESTQVIARQIRLRNLGGIIIIDFIDMQSEAHKRQLLRSLEKHLARDHAKSTITEVSRLGLVEMTRKRTSESLEHILCEPCPVCNGRGSIKTVETIAFEVFREIIRESRQFESSRILVLASARVANFLMEEQSSAIAELEEFIGSCIQFQVIYDYDQEQYDVVPL